MKSEPGILTQAEVIEPRAGSGGIPLWLVVLSFLGVFWGMVYFDRNGGWFQTEVYAPFHDVIEVANAQPPTGGFPRALAQKKFEATCAVCHQPTGMGVPGQFPPLVGSEWANGSPNRLIRIPLVGLVGPITVKGQLWNSSMASLGGTVNDEDLALILTYVRSSWGNKASEIKADQVKAVRAELGNRAQITEPELMKVPEENEKK